MKNPILLGLDRGVWNDSIQKVCEECEDLKFDGLEIQPEHPEIFKTFPDAKQLRNILSSYDLKIISVHAPIKDINISSYNPNIRKISLIEMQKTIKFATQLSDDIAYVVVHAGQNSFRSPSKFEKSYLPIAMNHTIDTLKNLMQESDQSNIKLSIENMTFSPWRLSSKIKYLDQIFHEIPELSFTFDYAHGLYGSEKYSIRILKRYESRLISVHVGNFFEIRNVFPHIKHLNPFIIIEPHHLHKESDLFNQLQIIIRQIRALQ